MIFDLLMINCNWPIGSGAVLR